MSRTPESFAERLASSAPTPGGGAAAARTGLHATCLLRMSLAITLEKLPEDGPRDELAALESEARVLGERFDELERADMAAFEAFLAALRLPRGDPGAKARRKEAIRSAARGAADVPLATQDAALATLAVAERVAALAEKVEIRAESDVGVAVELAAATFRASEINVLVNLSSLGEERSSHVARLDRNAARLDDVYPRVRGIVRGRLSAD